MVVLDRPQVLAVRMSQVKVFCWTDPLLVRQTNPGSEIVALIRLWHRSGSAYMVERSSDMRPEVTASFADSHTADCTAELAEYKGGSGSTPVVESDLATSGCQIDLSVGHRLAEGMSTA